MNTSLFTYMSVLRRLVRVGCKYKGSTSDDPWMTPPSELTDAERLRDEEFIVDRRANIITPKRRVTSSNVVPVGAMGNGPRGFVTAMHVIKTRVKVS